MDNVKSVAARAWAWYRALWSKGRWGIAAGIVIPLLILGTAQAALQSVGVIETPPTATPRPTQTPAPTSAPRPTDEPPTDAPTTAPTSEPTAVPATVAPVIQPAIQAPPPVVVPPTDVPLAGNDPNTKAKCADFPNRTAAQRWWAHWNAQGIANPGGLDGSNPPNGIVCEHLSP